MKKRIKSRCCVMHRRGGHLLAKEWRGGGRADGTVKGKKAEPMPTPGRAELGAEWPRRTGLDDRREGKWAVWGSSRENWDNDSRGPGYCQQDRGDRLKANVHPPIAYQLEPSSPGQAKEELLVGGRDLQEVSEAIERGTRLGGKKFAEARES